MLALQSFSTRQKKAGSEEPDLFDYDAIRMELELLFNKNNFSI